MQGQGQGASLPAAPQPIPGLPENADFFDFAGFEGIDTKPPRPAVGDDKAAWMDNLMPLGLNNLRAVPDCGAALYNAPGDLTIIHFDFFGLQPMGVNTGPYAAIFLSDGSAIAIRLNTADVTTIAAPGTFSPPAGTAIATRQYGTQYFLIATTQNLNSYWVWDGSSLYTAGTIGPQIDITSGGHSYTSTPTISVVGGTGSGATFSSTVVNGSVSTIAVTASGAGWLGSDATKSLLLFTGGGSGTSAYGNATVVNGAIVAITVVDGGKGFTSIPGIAITDGTGSGASAIVNGISGGSITSIKVLNCGSNYSTSAAVATVGGGGTGAVFAVTLENGVIQAVNMVQNGSGYIEKPTVFFLSATGSGAQGTAILSGSMVGGVDFGDGTSGGFTGAGYDSNTIVGFSGGGGPASATVQLMPFGVQGNAIEVYQARVWISTTTTVVKVFFSAPSSVVNFGAPAGGGVFPATESTLRYQFTNLVASNGFLYLIGDSNVNYVSGVQTTGSPAITTFSNLNVDPQIGSPWRDSVQVYSRAIMMANTRGIFAIYGGAVQMVSAPLDGIFDSAASQTATVLNNPSSAVAEIFSVHVYMLLLPIVDPVTNQPRNALLCWDGKRWWTASQNLTLTKIATQEWGSQINAWGTDGKSLVQLFTTPSTNTTKTLQSKLSYKPSIISTKKPLQLYAFWKATQAATLAFTVDTEAGATAVTQGAFTAASGYGFARSNVGDVVGTAVGFTMTSPGADFTLINATFTHQNARRMRV